MHYAIETEGLTKHFGDTRALEQVDLKIRKGAVYGLLGPNGAGKTTTIRLLATLLKPTAGSARVLGHDIVQEAHEVRRKVCLTGQYASVDEDLTGRENLVMIGRLLGLPWRDAKERARELLGAFGLSDAAKRQVSTYSGGMRRRLDIAAGLIVTPEVVFLDEPTTGLDPRSRNQVWEIIRTIVREGTTVLLTTQYMEEADRLAERLAVVDHGRVIAEGTSSELKESVGANTLRVRLHGPGQREKAEKMLLEAMQVEIRPGDDPFSFVATIAEESQVPEAYHVLTRNGLRLAEFAVTQPSMDEVFFALTGRPAEEKGDEGKEEAKAGARIREVPV